MMILTALMGDIGLTDWIIAGLAGFILGFGKAGIKGLGAIIVTLMAIVFGGKASTGIILPLLIIGDILAVVYYRRDVQFKILLRLLPWVICGVVIGAFVGQDMPEKVFKNGMALIILTSVVIMFLWDRRKSVVVPNQWWFAGTMGVLAGITTMIGNLAGAFSNIFFLAMRLPKNQFIGTAAWLFFLVNLFKLPFHILMWKTITVETLRIDATLAISTIIGFFVGVKIVALIGNQFFRHMILLLTAMGAVLILLK